LTDFVKQQKNDSKVEIQVDEEEADYDLDAEDKKTAD
jgi:hypothetical protein